MYLTLTTEEAEHEETYNDPISVPWPTNGRWMIEVEAMGWELDSVHDTAELAQARLAELEAQNLNVRMLPATADLNEKIETAMTTIVCSCGSTTCGAIGVFGLPRPVFHDAIEPIPSQLRRDTEARALKASIGS